MAHTGFESLCNFRCSPGWFQLDYFLSHHFQQQNTS